mmetsp:Transcript_11314/g.31503  ORF Transcript_11314/g.31503 Transcript_11314/m.31503 type:complete len:261 (+) Transcript_11314:1665-2447(+)
MLHYGQNRSPRWRALRHPWRVDFVAQYPNNAPSKHDARDFHTFLQPHQLQSSRCAPPSSASASRRPRPRHHPLFSRHTPPDHLRCPRMETCPEGWLLASAARGRRRASMRREGDLVEDTTTRLAGAAVHPPSLPDETALSGGVGRRDGTARSFAEAWLALSVSVAGRGECARSSHFRSHVAPVWKTTDAPIATTVALQTGCASFDVARRCGARPDLLCATNGVPRSACTWPPPPRCDGDTAKASRSCRFPIALQSFPQHQ